MRATRAPRDLVDVANIDAVRLSVELTPTDLPSLLRLSAARLEQLFGQRNVRLVIDVPQAHPRVDADAERIQQLVTNLLSNAAKFASENGMVTLAARQHDDEIVVSVQDDGQGIPPEHIAHVFDRFWRGRRGGGERGTGLGLSIAKGIAEAHGGRVWVESTEGQGSTFFFSLPYGGTEPSNQPAVS